MPKWTVIKVVDRILREEDDAAAQERRELAERMAELRRKRRAELGRQASLLDLDDGGEK